MKAPINTTPRVLAPAGTHVARVVGIIYIGTVTGEWQGKPKESFKVRLSWELPNEKIAFKEGELEKPFVVSKEYTFSMGSMSRLRPIVEGIIGTNLSDEEAANFELENILSMPCLISITHEESPKGKFVSVNTTAGLIKGMECPPQVNKTNVLSYFDWNQEYFDSLPDFIKDKMKTTPEYKKLVQSPKTFEVPEKEPAIAYPADEINPDEIPF